MTRHANGKRIPKWQTRSVFWQREIEKAPTGKLAVDNAVRWLRSELAEIEKRVTPDEADEARRVVSAALAKYAAQLVRYKPPKEASRDPAHASVHRHAG